MNTYHTIQLYSDELAMTKRIYVAVPDDYETSTTSYPVLYMHDGQNLFDDKTAFMNRSWRLFDVFQSNSDLPKIIIVGIDSDGTTRSNQLIPYPFTYKKRNTPMGGQADLYLDFICNRVKPLIDQRYRTKPEPASTAMMGSSFGGVNSVYAALTKKTFSKIASLSGAFHYDFFEPLMALLQQTNLDHIDVLYMDTGSKETGNQSENNRYLNRNDLLARVLRKKLGSDRFLYQLIEDGIHHESAWQVRFADIIRFLYQN